MKHVKNKERQKKRQREREREARKRCNHEWDVYLRFEIKTKVVMQLERCKDEYHMRSYISSYVLL